jgi:LuxR family maltose regulon positive regulatory protein
MLAGDLSRREIGSELFLSVNTVKTHTHNLYVKLGVNSREAAVRQAHALGLIETDDSPG